MSVTICLIAAGHHHLLYDTLMNTTDIEQVVGTTYIGLKRGKRAAQGCPNDRLRTKMKDSIQLMFIDRPVKRAIIFERPANDIDALDHTTADKFALSIP